mmetsp:Transcript_141544/g.394453  ORF Transcript_141544/g.394453 Transcript_141544/m.394453 type:complete len:210 (+) Transcript_141544:436-1065(+)
MLISPRPLNICAISMGWRRLRNSWSTVSGTALSRPRLMASTCASTAPKRRHLVSASVKPALFASVTSSSCGSSLRATSAAPTCKSRRPGQLRSLPGNLSVRRTSGGNAAVVPAASSPDLSSWRPLSAKSRASSFPKGSEKLSSKPNSATVWVMSHRTFVRSSSSSTCAKSIPAAVSSKPKRRAHTCGCNGKSRVQLCQSARPRRRPIAS